MLSIPSFLACWPLDGRLALGCWPMDVGQREGNWAKRLGEFWWPCVGLQREHTLTFCEIKRLRNSVFMKDKTPSCYENTNYYKRTSTAPKT